MTTCIGDQKSSTHDNFDLTLFGLDMEGDKYSLMAVNGVFTEHTESNNLEDAPPEIFMSFDLPKSGEILESRFFKDKIDV